MIMAKQIPKAVPKWVAVVIEKVDQFSDIKTT
jgi:hypothetical protein